MLIAINYHYVRPTFDDPYPGVHGVTPGAMSHQLGVLADIGRFVGSDEVMAALDRGLAFDEPWLLVTFDDGLREQFEVAWPALQALGVPAIFFVNTKPILERTLSQVHKIHLLRARTAQDELSSRLDRAARRAGIVWPKIDPEEARAQYPYDSEADAELKYRLGFGLAANEREDVVARCFDDRFPGREAELADELYMEPGHLRELAESQSLGTHGHEHIALGTVPVRAARELLAESVDHLERITGQRPVGLSYPYGGDGSWSPEVVREAQRLGLRFAFTMDRKVNLDLGQPLTLGRFDCNDLPGGKSPVCSLDALRSGGCP